MKIQHNFVTKVKCPPKNNVQEGRFKIWLLTHLLGVNSEQFGLRALPKPLLIGLTQKNSFLIKKMERSRIFSFGTF